MKIDDEGGILWVTILILRSSMKAKSRRRKGADIGLYFKK
jgi:hypothetical protein